MQFEFATANKILFGTGTLARVGAEAAGLGRRSLIVCGLSGERAGQLVALLADAGVGTVLFPVRGEPLISTIQEAAISARRENCDLVIGFGGGSAMDTAKAVAAVLANPGDLLDYLEVVGRGKPLEQAALPCIAIPTTAGTGSEVTRNAVLGVPEKAVKVSLRSPSMLPRLALVDPELTYDLPPAVTASTGLDALTQLIEPYVSNKANPLTDALCREGMVRAARSLRRAYQRGDPEAREDMSLASLFGGLALANARLGAVHGFAGTLGGMTSAPHGAICARLLPFVMEANLRALRSRGGESGSLLRYAEVAQILTGQLEAKPEDGLAWVSELCADLQIRPLGSYGLSREDFSTVVESAGKASSMGGNPVRLLPEEMVEILDKAL